ncbi:MAG: GNAT family N-acetyltransferase [Bacteroidota bacterium]
MDIKLQTQRLLLSPISPSDLEKIHELHSLPETDRFNTLGIPDSLNQTREIIEDWVKKNNNGDNTNFTLKIKHTESQEFVGLIALNLGAPKFKIAEVWYKLHSDFWKKGFATEALNRILTFGFVDLGLHRIEAGCAVENLGSIRVLEKVGMTREGRKRQVLPLKDGWSDNFHYAILASDFNQDSN